MAKSTAPKKAAGKTARPKQSPEQKATVTRVMDEFKHGELSSGSGDKVRNPKQAIAIALSEAGASNRQSPAEKRKRAAKTKPAG